MTAPPLAIGLVGAGPWAQVHARHLAAHPGIRVSGVWARRPEAAASLAAAIAAPVASSYDELLDASAAVDLCVPPGVQPALALRAASVGRHLLLEKPVALSSDDARLVADTAAAAGVVTQLMLTRRYDPVTREFLGRIRDLTVDGVSGQYSHGAFLGGPFATPWRLTEGVLLDLGPHLLDLLEQVAGPFVSVSARRNRHDAVAIAGLHAEGALSSVLLSGRAGGPGIQRLVAFGESGSLTYDPGELDESVCFRIAFDEFLSAVHHGTPVVADARRGDDLQRLLGACLESIGTGASVDV